MIGRLVIEMPPALKTRLRVAAVLAGKSLKEIVIEALIAWLDAHEARQQEGERDNN